ncbi:ABC transporter permease [Ensifer adhaerens]|uniref:ABC transporter permease n=1 Tax=Ensifer adhaerens TaxID=106592 RepID=UPI0018F82C59|nr:ABC transporter permease [Ensifer adhaerens]
MHSLIVNLGPRVRWRRILRRVPPIFWALMLMLLLSVPLLAVYSRAGGMSWAFISNMLERSVTLAIVAVGQTFVILVGSVDLSVAFVISLAAVLASFIMQGDPSMIAVAVPLILLGGALIGVVNGVLVTRLNVNPLIATLGTGLIIQGVLNTSFQNFAGSVPREYQQLAYGRLLGLPAPIFLLAALVALASFVLVRTRFGAHLYAVGGNKEAARLAGIRTTRVIMLAHAIAGLLAAAAGLFLVSRLGSGAPWVGPDGIYDLESIAAVVVGGALLAGGRGGVFGTLAGVLILGFIDSLFNQLGIDPYLKQVLRGAIIIAAVAVYSIRSREEVA